VAYKPEQGRYARMTSFWVLIAFWAFGCWSLWITLQGWLTRLLPETVHRGLRDGVLFRIPVLGEVNLAKILAIAAFAVGAWLIHKILHMPRIADLLIDTEAELRKVTWPTSKETYEASTVVIVTVVVLVAFVFAADYVLLLLAGRFMGLNVG